MTHEPHPQRPQEPRQAQPGHYPPPAHPGQPFTAGGQSQQYPQQYASFARAQEPLVQQQTTAVPQKKRRAPLAAAVTVALVGGTVFGGVAGAGAATWLAGQQTHSAQSNSATITGAAAIDPQTIADVAASASKSVVTVQVQSSSASGSGSGVVVAKGGYIVTNNHVVTLDGQSGDAQVRVQTSDGRLLAASIVGTDPAVDLAVLQVDADLPVMEFASTKPATGDVAIAIGAPLGLTNTVTDGIVSAVDRGLQVTSSEAEDQQGQSPFGLWDQNGTQAPAQTIAVPVLQTDASINPGNSGGALLNSAGQLIGINVAIAQMSSQSQSSKGSIGIGFAIEAALVQRVATEIIDNGQATHGLLGASVSDQRDTSVGVVGATLARVEQGGAAAAAGLQAGDVVTAINDVPVSNAVDLTAQVRAHAGGATVKATYLRDGTERTTEVTLGTLGA